MLIDIQKIQTKWYAYLPKFILLIWFTSYLFLDLFHHAPVISILSSAFWVIAWAIVLAAFLKDNSELGATEEAREQSERDNSLIWYDKLINRNITEKVSYLTISFFIVSLMFLCIIKYDTNQTNKIENYNYLLLYSSGSILLSLSLSLSYIKSIFDVKSQRILQVVYIVTILLGLCGAVLFGISTSYLPEIY